MEEESPQEKIVQALT